MVTPSPEALREEIERRRADQEFMARLRRRRIEDDRDLLDELARH